MSGYNLKIRLREGQTYLGNKKKSTEEVRQVVEKILSGDIMIPPPVPVEPKNIEVISYCISYDVANKLSIIADENKTSIVELLRLGLEQNNLVSSK